MLSKIIFVLATVCVVNASVLTIDVYDDDPETEVVSSPKDCNFQACDQLCRRLKFPGGACVNGRCKCDNFRNAEEKVPEESLASLEDPVLQQDDNEIEAETIKSNCNNQACDQLCRRLKFTGGVCVNGRCKCDNFFNAEDDVTKSAKPDVEDSVSARACNSKKCNELCRKKKFRGGACVGANCYCHKFLSLQDDTMTSADTVLLHSCNSIACDGQCRRSGWNSGVCINGQCKCDYFLYAEGAGNSLTNFEDSVSPKRCTREACNALCRKLQFQEGVCNGARCRCHKYDPTPKDAMNDFDEPISLENNFGNDKFLDTEVDAADEYSEFDTRSVCTLAKCNRICTRRGYEGGTCVKGSCKCFNITKTSLLVLELSENSTERGCNMQACDQLCSRLKFPGGACVNGRCKCDNFLGTDVDAVDKYLELATRRVCNLKQCQHTCARRGYIGARCINGRCVCDDFLGTDDASPLNDVTSDENEESKEILSNEEELIEPAPSACNSVSCNQWCHHLKYTGGWCRSGQCQCF